VKFTHEGGNVRLHVETLRATSLRGIQISVEDNGVGMDEETINNLFSIDKQNSRIGTAGEQGSGLGLIVCKELVEKNSGKLLIESKVDVGSKITIEI
jgi:signal transduction histidine kinase